MDGLSVQLQRLVFAFTRDVAVAIRSAALDALSQAMRPDSGDTKSTRRTRQGATRGARRRRTTAAIADVKGRLLAAIASKPGLRSEELRARLSLDRRDLAFPLRTLVTERKVKTTGARRGTRYFPARRMSSRGRLRR